MRSPTWNEVFSSLPDSAFFEVMRHYLGSVQTPFHKPDLVDQMEAFFRRPEVYDRVLSYIDTEDARFLTVIGCREGISSRVLASLFPDLRYAPFRERLLNLEERLLIWSRPSGRERLYSLTPLGLEVKASGILGPGTILGEGAAVEGDAPMSWFDDGFLNSALAFLSEGQPLFRKEGGWRKKTLETLAERFPLLFQDDRGEDRLLLAGRGLLAAGLAERRDDGLRPIIPAWRNLETWDSGARIRLLRARAAVGRTAPPQEAVPAIQVLSECLPADRAYPPETLAALFQLALGPTSVSPLGARHAISHLELMGVLHPTPEGNLRRGTPMPDTGDEANLSITPAGDIALRPGSTLFCDLALSGLPDRHDIVASFRMDKARFQAGLDHGVDPDRLLTGMERRSGHPLPQNIRILCREWEAEHRELRLNHCIALQADGVRREILERTGVLDSWTFARPAVGIWLLDPGEESSWRAAMEAVGIDRLPPIKSPSGAMMASPSPGENRPHSEQLPWAPVFGEPELCRGSWNPYVGRDPAPALDELRRAAVKSSLSPEESEAFSERLERRVILVPEQIRKGAWRYEVMTAKGLDYRGKIRLAEAAMSGRDERLAITVAAGIEVETVLVLPKKLEKDGDDHVLVGLILPEEEEVRYKIRKIGFLKRIKASLF